VTRRIAAVLVRPRESGAPPGVDPAAFALALAEDTADVLADLDQCEPAVIACPPAYADRVAGLLWPDTPLLTVPDGPTAATTRAAFDALHALGATEAVIVAGDAPDLPGLLVGKLFSALSTADVAICPAASGLVAIAARLPAAPWLAAAGAGLDNDDAHARLAAAAPRPAALAVVSGWHRLRSAADIAALDYDLEGWDATRALLGGY
jgi:molybdopterin-guanine dinucleotide biosynthesis protein A